MTQPDPTGHDDYQRTYFSGEPKKRMSPSDTPYLRRHVTEALRCAGARPQDRVIEIGCGMGRYTLLLAAQGTRVEGLDFTPAQLDRLREYNDGRYDIPLHCVDIAAPPEDLAGAFDLVMGFFVLHHVRDVKASLAAAARLLRPGGRMVFVEPNPFNPLYYVQILFAPRMTWRGERGMLRMRRDVFFRAAAECGLEGAALTRFGFFPPFLANRPLGATVESLLERVPLWRWMLPFQIFKCARQGV
jgi:SAM-dependent methyltransferase